MWLVSERCVVYGERGYVVDGYFFYDHNLFSQDISLARIFQTFRGAKQFITFRKSATLAEEHLSVFPVTLSVTPPQVSE